MSKVIAKTRFDFIRYSNCWEDADILVESLCIGKGDRCLSISSAGDNSLALLVNDPASVTAIDLNIAQIACLELKISAFKNLCHKDTLEFLGIINSDNRLEVFDSLKHDISEEVRTFWEQRPGLINSGIIHAGKLESFFHKMYKSLKFVHPFTIKNKINKLLEKKDLNQQSVFYHTEWNNLRWRLLIKIFYSNTVLGHFGRDPNFYRYVEQSMSDFMLEKNDFAFTSIPIHNNPYFNYIFTGNFPLHALPLYLRPEYYDLIKSRISRISIVRCNLLNFIDQNPDITYDAFNLSNIFEYMDAKEYISAFQKILAASKKGSRIAYYNAFVDRLPPDFLKFRINDDLSAKLTGKAGAFFYKRFIIGNTI